MSAKLSIYIDEAGDPGVRDGLRYAASRHEWLCLAAVVTRTSRDGSLVEYVKEMRAAANSTQAGALHYHKITASRRVSVCETLARKPVRAFVLATHKSNMREYVNDRIGAMIESGKFYNWCMRLLLERVTHWCRALMLTEGDPDPGGLDIMFAERGGHDYEHFFAYMDLLRMQAENGTLFLKSKGLHPKQLDRSMWTVKPAEEWAGLQIADTIASAFYQAANTASPSWSVEPAAALQPIIAEERGAHANAGVTVWPLPHQANLPEASRPIFRLYGYNL